MNKEDLILDKLKWLICHKIKSNLTLNLTRQWEIHLNFVEVSHENSLQV